MFVNLTEAARYDCEVLLNRALKGKTLNAFGVDGNGQYGTSYHGMQFVVAELHVHLDPTVTEDLIMSWGSVKGTVAIGLHGYNATVTGHVITDQNLKISLNKLLQAATIDSTCWSWGSAEMQGADFFLLNLDVNRLLEW